MLGGAVSDEGGHAPGAHRIHDRVHAQVDAGAEGLRYRTIVSTSINVGARTAQHTSSNGLAFSTGTSTETAMCTMPMKDSSTCAVASHRSGACATCVPAHIYVLPQRSISPAPHRRRRDHQAQPPRGDEHPSTLQGQPGSRRGGTLEGSTLEFFGQPWEIEEERAGGSGAPVARRKARLFRSGTIRRTASGKLRRIAVGRRSGTAADWCQTSRAHSRSSHHGCRHAEDV